MKRRDFLSWSSAACAGLGMTTAAAKDGDQQPPAAKTTEKQDAESAAAKDAESDAKPVESAPAPKQSLLEWRTYEVADEKKQQIVSKYLSDAAMPAWERLGIGPVGVFTEVGEGAALCLHALLTYADPMQFAAARGALEGDDKYRAAAAEYLAASKDDPAFVRIESSLMASFVGMSTPQRPEKKPLLYELRTYESHSESKARRKVEMFNDGEIPIFRECGFEPVFFGETLVGSRLPNLKYMLAAADVEANKHGWDKFLKHPKWLEMRDLPKYADTVSNVVKKFLVPTPFSQL